MKRNFKQYGVAAMLLSLAACSSSPTGRSQLAFQNEGEMASMGAQSFEQLKQKEKVSTDTNLNNYVQCVAKNIVQNVPASYGYEPAAWEVVVFDSDQVNAFALPGAKIGVYTGLLKVAQNQDQLAAVIGHEVGHVMAKHSNERMSTQILAGVGMAAAGVALSDVDNKGAYLAVLGLGATYGLILPYSRVHESEADMIGQELMAESGFDPAEAAELWRNMAKASGGNAPPELASTHPSPQTRINDLTAGVVHYNQVYKQAQANGKVPNCKKSS
ncbi:M48 family metallopeptidase [Echinimonas agarilytica]|uniref:M48 family metallopeptidase n=1 Tax=Echinimonas agarilytica TaxID=1215918 RepID=A0AA42B7A3_9GAMM|nr:M48 family metallopeptidase [Echinimonas agarilytica]MCM2679660.1 M48 family metallopeptidase [Echinimonas agarilytica]